MKIGAPYLCPAEKKTLLGSKSVKRWMVFAFDRFFKSGVGNCQPAEIGDAFAQNQLAVFVEAGFDFVPIKLLLNASCALIELLACILAAPIGEIPLSG